MINHSSILFGFLSAPALVGEGMCMRLSRATPVADFVEKALSNGEVLALDTYRMERSIWLNSPLGGNAQDCAFIFHPPRRAEWKAGIYLGQWASNLKFSRASFHMCGHDHAFSIPPSIRFSATGLKKDGEAIPDFYSAGHPRSSSRSADG